MKTGRDAAQTVLGNEYIPDAKPYDSVPSPTCCKILTQNAKPTTSFPAKDNRALSEKQSFAQPTVSFLLAPSHSSFHPNLQPRRQPQPIPHRRRHRHKIQMNAHSMHPLERPIPLFHLRTDLPTITLPPISCVYTPIHRQLSKISIFSRVGNATYPGESSPPSPSASPVRRPANSATLSLHLLPEAADR